MKKITRKPGPRLQPKAKRPEYPEKPEPSSEELIFAEQRIRALDALVRHCDWDSCSPDIDAQDARARWHRVMAIQTAFEEKYY